MSENPYQSPQDRSPGPRKRFYRPTRGEWVLMLSLAAFLAMTVGSYIAFIIYSEKAAAVFSQPRQPPSAPR
ncbi:MAG: hypothetical protein K8T25_01535 [Planctomycetia bacterium]|nr:hypothetical protein [Planctomycetia bacterium]